MKRALLMLAMAPVACSVYDVSPVLQPDVEIPLAWDVESDAGPMVDRWWLSFDDPQLDAHVRQALADNQSLRQAWARMAQAAAQAGISAAPLLPEVNLRTRSFNRSLTDVKRDGALLPAGEYYDSNVMVGAGLSWELDLWRRVANTAEAAHLAAQASRADVEATALALSGQVTDIWFTIRAKTELLMVLQEQVRVSKALLRSVEFRWVNGLGTALQVLQQRQQLEAVRAVLPTAESQLDTAWNALATLLGRTPQDLRPEPVAASLPALPAFPALGAPADLLMRRPDLRARQQRLAGADHSVAAAVAALLPTLRLSIDGDLQYDQFSGPLGSTTASVGGSLFQPLFDANRRGLEVDRQKAIVEERLGAFAETFLIAVREVDDAIEQETWQRKLLQKIDLQLDIARDQLKEANLQYTEGVAEYLDVISAIQTLQSLQRQHVETRHQLLVYRANLYLALGGDWMGSLVPPSQTQQLLLETRERPS
jgi:NodT family efflux transporter outer membrane factor (OMF) lipoprotein